MKFGQGMTRDDLEVDLEGHGHRSKVKVKVTRSEIMILGLIVVLIQVMRSRPHGSWSEVTWVKVKGHLG